MGHNLTSDNLPMHSEAIFIGKVASVYFNPYGLVLKDDAGTASLDFTEKHTLDDLKKYLNTKLRVEVKVEVGENREFKILEIKELADEPTK